MYLYYEDCVTTKIHVVSPISKQATTPTSSPTHRKYIIRSASFRYAVAVTGIRNWFDDAPISLESLNQQNN